MDPGNESEMENRLIDFWWDMAKQRTRNEDFRLILPVLHDVSVLVHER